MIIRKVAMAAVLVGLSSGALAQEIRVSPNESSTNQKGTPEEQAACRPNVRRFCRAIPAESGPFVFLACLNEHREKLSHACLEVLQSKGQ
jgi:hypothetical protein